MRIERRKEPRTSQQLTISYRAASHNGNNGGVPLIGTVLDLGNSGASLRLASPLRIEESLQLDGLPHHGQARHGNVKWIRKIREEYQIGVQFSGNKPSA